MAIPETPHSTNYKLSNKLNKRPRNLITLFSFTTNTTSSFSSSSPCSSSPSESIMEENIKNAEAIIQKWDINGDSYTRFISIFQDNTREATVFINCVTGLHRAMHFLVLNDPRSEMLAVAQRLMQIAMKRLEKEFHLILSDNREYLEPRSVSSWPSRLSWSSTESEDERKLQIISVSDAEPLSMIAISILRLIADTMISCGYGKECIESYKIIRKSAMDEALFHLGIQPYSSSHIKKMVDAPHFEYHVKSWLNAVPIAMKTLFHREKFLCDYVFTSFVEIRDSCFENSTKGALNLFTFPELIATRCKRLKSETIFVMMELYNSISNLWPEIESLFSYESVSSVKMQALSSLSKLGNSIRTVLRELESSIHNNSSKLTVSGGGIHPLNDSVMTYFSSLAEYGSALSDVIVDDLPFKEQSPFLESYMECLNTDEVSPPAVSVKLAWIILVLLCKLDGKAKFHNYVALSYLFLVNNLHFIIEKVRETNLKSILGEEWIMKHEKKLKQYVSSYESMSWNKVISCLPGNSVVCPEKVKDCFRRLYSTFEEVYGKQTTWIVVDEKMRDKMKVSIANRLVPAYEEFYGKHLITLSEDERCKKMLTSLSPENMANCLSVLFPGSPVILRNSGSFSLTLPTVSVSQTSRPFR
ncbi:exocyst complex component EXO70H1 [Lactuca sativa]|nr:exocyst complex component EXO70H1 [Lactuca sativa]